MTTYPVTKGPTADEIFTAARHATNSKWRTPLEFTVASWIVKFNWVNSPTWMGELSKYLRLDVKYAGYFFIIEYDTQTRVGELWDSQRHGQRNVDLIQVIEQQTRETLSRVQRSL